jgi:hypothetical protein
MNTFQARTMSSPTVSATFLDKMTLIILEKE